MRVRLISVTPYAKEMLVFTKNTRHLSHNTDFEDVFSLTEEEMNQELEYVLSTIPGPLEFVDYIFLIQDVSRAFTHQLVRTRTGSYAQQSQRVADMSDFRYFIPDNIEADTYLLPTYEAAMNTANDYYGVLLRHNADNQDARGVLPTNICTNIVMKIDLRNLSQLMETRLCVRTQGEYQHVALAMRSEVFVAHPWATELLLPICAKKGYCNFPRFEGCPLKKKYPHLKPVERPLQFQVIEDWETLIDKQYSPQPKV